MLGFSSAEINRLAAEKAILPPKLCREGAEETQAEAAALQVEGRPRGSKTGPLGRFLSAISVNPAMLESVGVSSRL